MILRSWAGAEPDPYQEGTLGELLPVPDILGHLGDGGRDPGSTAVFLGTLPLRTPGFVFADRCRVQLASGDGDLCLELDYRVRTSQETSA